MTFRAVRILKEAARVACEDTRATRKLLDHYSISTPTVSYHEFLERLNSGESIALVTNADTPLISDPGYRSGAATMLEPICVSLRRFAGSILATRSELSA